MIKNMDNKYGELAESFINGNLRWVKDRTKRKASFIAVLRKLEMIDKDIAEKFIQICG